MDKVNGRQDRTGETCVGCYGPTDTGILVHGEPAFHLVALKVYGHMFGFEASTVVTQDRDILSDERYSSWVALCSACATLAERDLEERDGHVPLLTMTRRDELIEAGGTIPAVVQDGEAELDNLDG